MQDVIKVLRVFYGFETRRPVYFIALFFITVATSILNAINPIFFKLFVDSLYEHSPIPLTTVLFVFIAVRLLALIFNNVMFIVGDVVLHDAVVGARKAIFKYVQELDFAFHTNKSSGSLISAFKRGDAAFYSLHHVLNNRFVDILVSFIVMAFIFSRLSPVIAFITMFFFIISLVATQFVVKHNVAKRRAINDEEDKVSAIIVDNMINYETVKLFAKESWEERRLSEQFKTWLKASWGYVYSFRVIDFTIGGLIILSTLIILLVSISFVNDNKMTPGDFILITAFVSSFFPKFWELVYNYRDLAKNFADVQKYFELLEHKIEVKDPQIPVETAHVKGDIKFEGVSFSYKGGKKNALRNISLRIVPGESIALVGRSGSGKTTITKLLMRFYDPDSGVITIDGIDIKNFTKSRLRSFMGVVPQEPILFNNTIAYNIGYGKENANLDEIKEAAKLANLDRFIESLPKGYKTDVGERGIKLSGGQKQRLAIARMILSDPDIIIFDEATSQLDSENEKLISDAFWKAAKGKTTIIIAHRLSTASRAGKILVMERGRIVEIDTHESLVGKKDSLYKYFWDLQTKPV